MELNYIIIGKRIKEVRKKRKLSQEALAELIEKSPPYISYIETAKKHLSLETLIDIANALHISVDSLLAANVMYKTEVRDEFSELMSDCEEYEKRIIVDTVKTLKQSLRLEL